MEEADVMNILGDILIWTFALCSMFMSPWYSPQIHLHDYSIYRVYVYVKSNNNTNDDMLDNIFHCQFYKTVYN